MHASTTLSARVPSDAASTSARVSTGAATSGDPGGESSEAGTVAVAAVDHSYELDEDSVSPGTYGLTLTDDGGADPDLVVERGGAEVARSEPIGPGGSTTFEVTLEAGAYVLCCSIGNHRAMGMEVPVEVTS